MIIELKDLGKRFGKQVIFKSINYQFQSGKTYGVLGHNGSGKSTLLRVIAGINSPSKGEVSYSVGGKSLSNDEMALKISYAGPYTKLFDDLTVKESLDFHQKFRNWREGINSELVLQLLAYSPKKKLHELSSGMYQRLKIALALLTDSSLVLLDEPSSNFDKEGVKWFKELLKAHSENRIVIIASPLEEDLEGVDETLLIKNYKA